MTGNGQFIIILNETAVIEFFKGVADIGFGNFMFLPEKGQKKSIF